MNLIRSFNQDVCYIIEINILTDEQSDGRKNARKTFKLGGVPVNAKTLSACQEELAPLDEFLPQTKEERLKWQLDFR